MTEKRLKSRAHQPSECGAAGQGLAAQAVGGSVADALARESPQKQTWPASTPAIARPWALQCWPHASSDSAQQKFAASSPLEIFTKQQKRRELV